MMDAYLELGLLPHNPFETIDDGGVGELVRLGTERGRATRPGLKFGVCGEHGGDPASIDLFYRAGLDYVSCSPFRVPVARLAAAQAVLEAGARQPARKAAKARPADPAAAGTAPDSAAVRSSMGIATRRSPRSGPPPTSWRSSASTRRSRRWASAGAGCARSTPRRRRRSRSTPRRASTTASGAASAATRSRFVRETQHLDFVDAVRQLAERGGITLHEDCRVRTRRTRSSVLSTPWSARSRGTTSACCRARRRAGARLPALAVATTATWCAQFRLGWAPDDWDALRHVPPTPREGHVRRGPRAS